MEDSVNGGGLGKENTSAQEFEVMILWISDAQEFFMSCKGCR